MTHSPIHIAMNDKLSPDVREAVSKLVRPAIRLKHAEDGDTVVGQLGGGALLPDDFTWPRNDYGPYYHLGSFDLSLLPETDLRLPRSGRLVFFGDPEGTDGSVHYLGPDVELAETPPPGDFVSWGPHPHRSPVAAGLVDTLKLGYDFAAGDLAGPFERDEDAVDDELQDLADATGTIAPQSHRIGGYADEIQGGRDMGALPDDEGAASALSRPPAEDDGYVLLAQFDSDADAGFGWGDMGIFYFFIGFDDLRARRFEKAEGYWECF
ncbi:DUF1963 domain-containing protein [Salininema proteolyticum]|uniref:DUF1963 domain-containing protein n=1 Tax=Salininema proteolyticum TaxID=1607685 RepID=A0ABV8TX14_9ACTN